MTDEQMAKVPGGVQLLPMTAGEIVLGYNLPGNPKGLKLPRDVYPAIFLGKITKWNDREAEGGEPRREAARHRHHGGAARRPQRHDVRLHQPPRRHQRGVGEGPGRRARR